MELNLSGHFDEQANSMFAWEITAVKGIKHQVPTQVEFFSPDFIECVTGTGEGRHRRPIIERPDQHRVLDGAAANSDTNSVMLHAPELGISFLNPFEAVKVCKKKQNGANGRNDSETVSEASQRVSTEESDITGSTPRADWNISDDQSDDAHQYENKFICFDRMLSKLATEHHCKIISKVERKLPKVGRSARHIRKDDGLPRCIAVVEISCNGRSFHILEVDTSDAATSLATKLLLISDTAQWDTQLKELERRLIKSSLNWPRAYLDEIFDQKGHESIPHPKTNSANKGLLESESIDKWAQRFYGWMLGSYNTF